MKMRMFNNIFIFIYFAIIALGVNAQDYTFLVINSNISIELNPSEHFFSSQKIKIVNIGTNQVKCIYFQLHNDFIIDSIQVINSNDKSIANSNFNKIDTVSAFGNQQFAIWDLPLKHNVLPADTLLFTISFHYNNEKIIETPKVFHQFTISPNCSYSVFLGLNPLFGVNTNFPFTINITYPENYKSCVPGNLISSIINNGLITDLYKCEKPNVPSFSCGQYNYLEKSNGDLSVKLYLYPDIQFSENDVAIIFDLVDLYSETFSTTDFNEFNYAIAGEPGTRIPAGENKLNTSFLSTWWIENFSKNLKGKVLFYELIAHETYHNWNLRVNWTDSILLNWFYEGGADFIASWATEKNLGFEAGRLIRQRYSSILSNYSFDSLNVTLMNVEKTGGVEDILLYKYGSFVWEQLRQKIGDEALFNGLHDFYQKYSFNQATSADLFNCFEDYTEIDVLKYLSQWTKQNAKIDLTINKVVSTETNGKWLNEVYVNMLSDNAYELFTTLGYKMKNSDVFEKIPVHLTQKGMTLISFESKTKPATIQIDFEYRVPQSDYINDLWKNKEIE